MWLLTLIWIVALSLGGLMVLSALVMLLQDDFRGWVRQAWREWRAAKAEEREKMLRREWNPRPSALREYSRMDIPKQIDSPQLVKTDAIARGSVRTNVRVIHANDSTFGG